MSCKADVLDIRPGILRGGLWIKPITSYYSADQVVQWLSRINYETTFTEQEVASGLFPANLRNLSTLMRLHLVAFPFENTAMHYTPDHYMDISPEGAFRRLVQDHNGSYCFGQNTVFLGILRGLGYRAYSGVARVNKPQRESGTVDYTALAHMIIFVQPIADSNETYVVDVGFGSPNLSQPILLSDAETNIVWGSLPPEAHRLTRGAHPLSSLETLKSSNIIPSVEWRLELTHNIENPNWSILYAFSENEFFIPDHESESFSVCMAPEQTIFWHDVIITKHFLLGDKESDAIEIASNIQKFGGTVGTDTKIDRQRGTWLGRYTMARNRVMRQVGPQSEIIREFEDERQRIQAVREIFGINIDDSAAKYIEGRASALRRAEQV